MLKIVPQIKEMSALNLAKLSQHESAKYRDGEAQAITTRCQCQDFKETETIKLYMARKGKCPEFRRKKKTKAGDVQCCANLYSDTISTCHNVAGILSGGKFLWMLKLLLVHGENFVVKSIVRSQYKANFEINFCG